MASTSSVDWKVLDIEALQVDPNTLRRREKNAHYMAPAMFKRLVENVKIDGRLTTTVLACENKDGSLEILSGHHRTAAAIEAGLPMVDALVITTPLSEKRKVAIQLSHNSINGEDDQSLLAQLYASLDIDAKKFSGLDDSVLAGDKGPGATALGGANIKYDELLFSFLPEDRVRFEVELEALAKRAKRFRIHAAPQSKFDEFFDTIVRTKSQLNIVNSGIALSVMARLAGERLDQLEAEAEDKSDAA
ncbi:MULTISPECIES: ParB/RepB/Spo0J family partition protein [unclassified Mesorhizobium]|uniref:ParB/RepB/Spo0J family partition protein n=1 Tax=unclassified Mesorhizobium TaxID=325217 RepID=UPI002415925A|nr:MULTISPECIES: ParB/RepB/Spo0J family partition protein [unclassified Mesorhizobium]MDG4853835.1 ParB/RepB/Spo0J family partition protein [Mesorhizobium sp. WSM4982]MDG4915680.1 ParB/RepB/Spo0J family partition protein [Mesorhizobium sp. WSM4983]